MFDYLERHCAEGYKREFEMDEHVHRSLPFFAATMAFEVAIVIQVGPKLPALVPAWSLGFGASVLLHLLIVLWGALMLRTAFFLLRAVAPRDYLTAPPELSVLEWARSQRSYWQQSGAPRDQVEALVEEEARELISQSFAEALAHNRPLNAERFEARSQALTHVIFALVVVLLIGGLTFMVRQIDESRAGGGVAAQAQTRPTQVGPQTLLPGTPGVAPGKIRPAPQGGQRRGEGDGPIGSPVGTGDEGEDARDLPKTRNVQERRQISP